MRQKMKHVLDTKVITLTESFVTLDRLVNEDAIDVERLWNLIDTGRTPVRYAKVLKRRVNGT